MRSLAALLVLLCLAVAGLTARLGTVDGATCTSGAVASMQPAEDDADDAPWELPDLHPPVTPRVSDSPEAATARHTPRLHDQRRSRPPRA